ncbi:hypothetical protein GCM10010492_50020 [Saccharothrix mutabilis subsp. mutabilis]|uniref:Uncharacterized protein n=1 Tax=Saccharothrix mutabilis subsp. mutabilis TaxID=66855 RepID=A0ABN0UB29_9PSEU
MWPAASVARVRLATLWFCWLGGIAFIAQLLFACSPLGWAAAALAATTLTTWLARPDHDGWTGAAVEALCVATACQVLDSVQPIIGFLFAVTIRRSLVGGGDEALPVKAVGAVAGYLVGSGVAVVGAAGAWRDGLTVEGAMPALLPLIGLVVAVTALHQTARAARLAQEALLRADESGRMVHAVLRAGPVGIAVLDGAGVAAMCNERAERLLAPHGGRVPCEHEPDITTCARGCAEPTGRPVEVHLGAQVLALHTAAVPLSDGDHLVVAAVDITDQRTLQDQLRLRSERDELTGLISRSHFLELLDRELTRSHPVALLVVDLDGFKEVNDRGGHAVGDAHLRTAADRIRTAVAGTGAVARLGGDEFAVLVAHHDNDDAVTLARTVLTALADATADDPMRASIGIATSAPAPEAGETLLRDADIAMYAAKRDGGNRVRVFDRRLGDQVRARQQAEDDLRAALGTDQFVVHYQPIVALDDQRVTGAEALARWQRPGHGLTPPQEFIPLAEETGMIVPLGRHVLSSACTRAAGWQSAGRPLGVTVNVSTRQLADTGFAADVTALLASTGLDPHLLTIEVTESVWADEAAMRVLTGIRETGVRVALDDFGTGYSSLSYLQRYPFDVIKIDKSFTWSLEDPRTGGVVRCIIDLAGAFGATTVAEGVETVEQADWLRAAGCGYAQGFLYGRPSAVQDEWTATGTRP